MGITNLREPSCANASTQMTTTFQSANATWGDVTEGFHTSNDELPRATHAPAAPELKRYSL